MEHIDQPATQNTALQSTAELKEIIALLKRQNEILDVIGANLTYSMVRESEKRHTILTRVTDLDISIGAMMGLMMKWLVASIPVGILLAILWFFIYFVFGVFFHV